MFKTRRSQHAATPPGDVTRDRVLDAALALFRERGLDGATMRDLAAAAGLSVGSAYYYFPSKDALILAWYERVQAEHAARVTPGCGAAAAIQAKLDVVGGDRGLLGVLFRHAGEPGHPLSPFSPSTRATRGAALATFGCALGDAPPIAARALWALHLGVLLYFVHDSSPAQARTRRLVDRAGALFDTVRSLPGAAAMLAPVASLLADAGLFDPEPP